MTVLVLLRPAAVRRWVCGACGKTSSTREGWDGAADPGWDESCFMHAVLCKPAPPGGEYKWIAVDDDDTKGTP